MVIKKQLLIAAVAATISAVATADISITGDSYISFGKHNISTAGSNHNDDDQRVRLKVVGSAGDTKVVAVIRSGSKTRVDNAPITDDGGKGIHMDSLYLTTKVAGVDIKAGDYWGTIGLGARSIDAPKKNAIAVSTTVGGWKVGAFTANGSGVDGSKSTHINVAGKLGPVTVGVVHNPDQFTDISAEATFAGISIAAELWDDETDAANNTSLIHIDTKIAGIKVEIAQIKNDVTANIETTALSSTPLPGADHVVMIDDGTGTSTMVASQIFEADGTTPVLGGSTGTSPMYYTSEYIPGSTIDYSSNKLAPLGSMLIGTAARGRTATAVADVENFSEILGVAISTELAGNTVKVIYTKNTIVANGVDSDVSGRELIITRPISAGVTLTANVGKISGLDKISRDRLSADNSSNTGIRLDVKF